MIDTKTKICERINPYYPQFMDNKIDLATRENFNNLISFDGYLTPIDHSPLTHNCYFSILYYFEIRIINPQLTPNQVLSLISNIDLSEFNQIITD